ncbi:MAG: hypothetical protein HOV71_09175 [Hamadaea sp.]|nr:hypothetical protein [Hamadaea sp.]NUR48290.1 hypothetical protein [Hamadaea sp.]
MSAAARGGVYRRADVKHPAVVCVISNEMLHSVTPYVIVMPILPVADEELHAVQGLIERPVRGFLSPNHVTWLPESALGERLGSVESADLSFAVRTLIATVS